MTMKYLPMGASRFPFLLGLCVAVLLLVGRPELAAAADIERSCQARWTLTNKTTGATAVLDEFEARAGCGKTVPNRCRSRARDAAHACMSKHWETRFDRKKPAECSSSGITGYGLPDIKAAVENAACSLGWVQGGDVVVSLSGSTSGDKECGRTKTFSDAYIVKPAMCASVPSNTPKPSDANDSPALQIPANDTVDPTSGLKFPRSMPAIRYPVGYNDCSASEKKYIQQSWAMAHYMAWVADQTMDWMEKNAKYREKAWNHNFREPVKANDWVNYAPRGWFGAYSKDHFDIAKDAIDTLWTKRLRGKTFTVKCRTNDTNKGSHPCFRKNPGTKRPPAANHIVYGTINFCNNAFNSTSYFSGARLVLHELMHWLGTKNGTVVGDTHVHCHGAAKCVTDKGYGAKDAAHLANYDGGTAGTKIDQQRRRVGHRKRALRNNDNYALYMYYMGYKAYMKNAAFNLPVVTQFPASGFVW